MQNSSSNNLVKAVDATTAAIKILNILVFSFWVTELSDEITVDNSIVSKQVSKLVVSCVRDRRPTAHIITNR